MQADLEEEKAQEIAKLQDALREMQIQVEDANARVIKEREEAQKAIEEAPPIIKETPVIVQDTEKVESLTAEVESLKVSSLIWMIMVAFSPMYICIFSYHLHASYKKTIRWLFPLLLAMMRTSSYYMTDDCKVNFKNHVLL